MNLTFGSVCSGVEAASMAWEPLGWRPRWFSEIEKFPCDVLAHHWPHVPNLGSMLDLEDRFLYTDSAPDVLVGGTPCQAFSLAGKRLSLSDGRGNLTLAYIGVANALDEIRKRQGKRDTIIVWENVPGVLSTPDNAFGCFVSGLVGGDGPARPSHPPEGKRGNAHWRWNKKAGGLIPRWPTAGWVTGPQRTVAWRVLDAQWFGIPQRRRRVFLVGCSRSSGIDPREILFEPQSMCRDNPPSREERQGVTSTLAGGARKRGGFSEDDIPKTVVQEVAGTLGSDHGNVRTDQAWTNRLVPTLDANYGRLHGCSGQDLLHGHGHLVTEKTNSLVYGGNNTAGPIKVAPACNAKGGSGRMDFESEALCVDDVKQHMRVRRLTPNECEKLQGFNPGHTAGIPQKPVPASGQAKAWKRMEDGDPMFTEIDGVVWKINHADGPRYKAIGNSMAVPCMQWIGERIQAYLRGQV